MDSRVEYLTKRLSHLKEVRRQWEPFWDKAAELCAVNSKIYVTDAAGRIIRTNFDGTARLALNSFAASMKSILIPTNTIWHRLKPTNPNLESNDTVRRYLEYANNILFKLRYAPDSRFSSESTIQLRQMGIYGQAAWLVEDNVGRGISYRSIPIRETYADFDRFGVIDTVYREYELTARQALQEFGARATSEIREMADKNPDKKMRFLHAVEPRQDLDIRKSDYKGMPIASYHVDLDAGKLIYEDGYRVMPYMFPHYMGIEGSAYGSSPALQALQDILTLNEMAKTTLRAGQLQTNPPIFVGKGIKNASRVGSPGAIVPGLDANGKPLAAPLQLANNLSISLEMQQAVREIIEKSFLVPLFQSLTDIHGATAYEVQQRVQEKALLLAPTGELISSEWLVGNTRREMDIAAAYGYLDDVPNELMEDGSLAIEFESPAIHMQQATAITGLMEWLESVIGMSQVNPKILNIVDFDAAARAIADYKGVATSVIRSPEAVAQLGEEQAQQEQAQQLLQAAPVISQAVKNMGGMSNAQVS